MSEYYDICIDRTVPIYVLDGNYYFRYWNRCFSQLIAEAFNLNLGAHAIEFADRLDNKDECIERSKKIFGAGEQPTKDIEDLVLTTPKYGQIVFKKLAVYDEASNCWVVTLIPVNIEDWEAILEEF